MLQEFFKKNTSQDQNEQNKFFQASFVAMFLITGYLLLIYLNSKSNAFKTKKDDEGYTKEDRLKQEHIWNTYALSKALGSKLDNQTQLFFESLRKKYLDQFLNSTNQIIQFGICNGDYITPIAKQYNRNVIGYDYASIANTIATQKGAQMRPINLNNITADHELAYQAQLEHDFANISDVLLIRVLEYLNPEAVQLLMISMIKLAKPGSRFYIEILSPQADITDPSGQITISYSLKPGTIRTFFQSKGNFKITELDNSKNFNDKGSNTLERLLVEKINP